MLSVRQLAAIAIALLAGIAQAREVRPSVVVIRAEGATDSIWWRKISDQGVSFSCTIAGSVIERSSCKWVSPPNNSSVSMVFIKYLAR